MNKQQYEVNNLPTQIVIGHQTETGVTSIYFDCTSWLASWPDLVLGVWVTQPGGTAAYPAATHMEGDVLVWDVTDSDTAVPGTGTMEIVGIASGKKKLSAITKTLIQRTTTGTATEPPEGAKAWVDSVMQAANDAETSKSQAATYAQNAAASAEKAEENAKSVTWETLSGKPSTFPPDSHTHTLESLGAASAESVNQLKNDLAAEQTARASADQALANDKMQLTLLWENASPSSSFQSQTVPLDLNTYKYVIIEYAAYAPGGRIMCSICDVGYSSYLVSGYVADNYYKFNIMSREIAVNTNGITFYVGYTGNVIDSGVEDNKYNVPIKIYGVKG